MDIRHPSIEEERIVIIQIQIQRRTNTRHPSLQKKWYPPSFPRRILDTRNSSIEEERILGIIHRFSQLKNSLINSKTGFTLKCRNALGLDFTGLTHLCSSVALGKRKDTHHLSLEKKDSRHSFLEKERIFAILPWKKKGYSSQVYD